MSQEDKIAKRIVSKILRARKNFSVIDDLYFLKDYHPESFITDEVIPDFSSDFRKDLQGTNLKSLYNALTMLLDIELQKEHTLFDTYKLAVSLKVLDTKIIVQKNSKNDKQIIFCREMLKVIYDPISAIEIFKNLD